MKAGFMSLLSEKAKRFYDEQLKAELEPRENGKFIAIEPDSRKYFLAKTAVEAIEEGRAVLPGKMFFLARVGYPAAHKISGGRVKRNG